MSAPPVEHDPLMVATIDLLRRSGAQQVQIRWSDDEQPMLWMVAAQWFVAENGHPVPRGGKEVWDSASAMSPARAGMRLCEQIINRGGVCKHCGRPGAVTEEWRVDMPLAEVFCWYVFDPETTTFRRSCEGEPSLPGAGKVGRNDPCPCGSGRKFKQCHGA